MCELWIIMVECRSSIGWMWRARKDSFRAICNQSQPIRCGVGMWVWVCGCCWPLTIERYSYIPFVIELNESSHLMWMHFLSSSAHTHAHQFSRSHFRHAFFMLCFSTPRPRPAFSLTPWRHCVVCVPIMNEQTKRTNEIFEWPRHGIEMLTIYRLIVWRQFASVQIDGPSDECVSWRQQNETNEMRNKG